MSAVPPPNLVSSVLQSGYAQRASSTERQREDERQLRTARELTAADRAVEVEIEATDADTRVHTDAGGQGGAGRHHEEESARQHDGSDVEENVGGGLDLTA